MKLEKAIEIQTIHNDHNPNFTDQDRRDAHALSIEAMKRMKLDRAVGLQNPAHLLPGETEN